ncbi:MAG TPA: Ig-like domain-containing protein [Myxococcota bacterium]|nr:Ig-like domain-containing protein [Myxococcota bacterium]HRY95581.1 Ig-like domain-containing protein [Myxococcota bacterium]HSA22586.1 Ig-like domain-containing protein [Myxococcota bacterium]
MKSLAMAAVVLALGAGLGACGDVNYPSVSSVEVLQGEVVISTIEPKSGSETTIQDDVPVDAIFRIHFDEPMDLNTATDKIVVRENPGESVPVTLGARLEVVTATPQRALTGGLNHVLDIDSGIDDTSGNPTVRSYVINFYTAP